MVINLILCLHHIHRYSIWWYKKIFRSQRHRKTDRQHGDSYPLHIPSFNSFICHKFPNTQRTDPTSSLPSYLARFIWSNLTQPAGSTRGYVIRHASQRPSGLCIFSSFVDISNSSVHYCYSTVPSAIMNSVFVRHLGLSLGWLVGLVVIRVNDRNAIMNDPDNLPPLLLLVLMMLLTFVYCGGPRLFVPSVRQIFGFLCSSSSSVNPVRRLKDERVIGSRWQICSCRDIG
ncbi:hypothetical protein QBC32DRAFT_58529 [Pseudoneurospora amorphoporcata]|uniref:Uncharacterized protein n=1 Tax=Pseudoneurospora amorphoporcata TaxID=241081 RepID=A0AAN6SCU6_9PEZI|nr:hypothetical protein QBC32DRAFT_58529 [Pseudoneurospora amorphoporcata]